MVLNFNCYIINEASLKKLKKDVHGVLNMSARKRMRRELRDNIITFKFRKRNGDLRIAHGTLHPDYLPPLKGGPKPPEHQMVYYDLDKEGWRSFRSYSFIKILNIKPVGSASVTPPSKPSAAAKGSSQDDDEEIKKNSEMESEEQEEKEVKKVSKKHDDEEEHEYKSPIYDEDKEEKEEREEDDEKVKDIERKHKEKKEIIHEKEPEEEEESEETDKKDKKKSEEE